MAKGTTNQITIAAASLFPGFKFSPTDEELITYYLRKKLEGCEKSVEVITELEICRHEPWDLPGMSVIHSEKEWFFFSSRGRKYPNGTQSRRATELGYWKATGKERVVRAGNRVIGTKRTLVFHKGRAPKGERTEWIMHEFCMVGKSQDSPIICRLRRSGDGTNWASSSHAESDGDTEIPTNIGEDGMRRTMSSYSSLLSEQIESASESNQKLSKEAAVTESSTHMKDKDTDDHGDNVDDYFADILKDDIIKLDETPIPNVSIVDPRLAEPLQVAYPSPFDSLPGITTTSQRKGTWTETADPWNMPWESEAGGSKEHCLDDKGETFTFDWSPTCFLTTMVEGKTWTRRILSGAVVVVLVAVVLAYTVGGMKRASEGLLT